MALSLLTVPLLLGYLGPRHFGLWATLTAICSFNSLLDLGTGFSAQNIIARARALHEPTGNEASLAVTISFAVSLFATLLFAVCVLTNTSPFIAGLDEDFQWAVILNVFIGFSASAPLQVLKFAHASSRGHLQGVYAIAGSGLLFGASIAAARFGLSHLWFIALSPLAQLLPLVALWTYASKVDPGLRAHLSWHGQAGISLLRQGLHFLSPQLVGYFLTAGPVMVSASILGLESTALTHVYSRVANVFGQVRTQLLYPIWPQVAGAFAGKNISEVRHIATNAVLTTFILTVVAGHVIVFAGPTIVLLWVPDVALQSTTMHFAAIATYLVGISLLQAINYVMNGMDLLAQQTAGGMITMATILLFLGLVGSTFGQTTLWACFGIPLCVFYVPWCGRILHLELKRPKTVDEI